MQKRLHTFKKPRQGVTDPAGTLLLILGRLGWSAASARHFFTEKRIAVDLLAIAPKGLIPLIDAAASSWGDQTQVHGWRARTFWAPLKPLLKGGLAAWTAHHTNALIKLIGKGIGEGDRPDN